LLDDPEAVLEQSYEKQLAALQELKRARADLAAEGQGLAQQAAAAEAAAAAAETAAMLALQTGDETRARAALGQKQDALGRLERSREAEAGFAAQEEKLADYETRLRERIERFRVEQQTGAARSRAAAAQAKAADQLSGKRDAAAGAALRATAEKRAALEAK